MSNGSGDQSPPSPPTNLRVSVSTKPALTTFELHAKSLAGLADHTYVSCPDINKKFECFLMGGIGDRFISSSPGYYDVANLYRTPFILNDTAGLNPYGIKGVCHQAANRFLLATNPRIHLNSIIQKLSPMPTDLVPFIPGHSPLDLMVKGYLFSLQLYGIYGTDGNAWFNSVFHSAAKRMGLLTLMENNLEIDPFYRPFAQTMSAEQTEANMHLSENDIIGNVVCQLSSPIIPTVKSNKLKEDTVDLLKEKDRIIGSGMRGEEMANKINELVGVSAKSLASRLTDSEYRNLAGTQKGEEVLVVDPEIAAKCSK